MSHDHDTAGIDAADAVAIVGVAGRFPGAGDVSQFWANLVAGVESITVFGGEAAHEPGARSWQVNAGGAIEGIELFDADFFAVPPAEAAWMDPQHRVFLECAWLALEDAGCDPGRAGGPVAVYAGTNINTYVLERLDQLAGADRARVLQILVGNEKDFLATRVSYKLDLRGESVTVQTSCSTSLVAVHLACQSLLGGQSDCALAGGVSIRVPQLSGYTYEEGMIASPDGHCRPFDHRARGTVPGNGVGVVVLKRLEDAIAARDHCYAVIRGSWINNDGRDKVGFTAPSVEGQAEVIARAMTMAGVPAETIRFIETHGTGTVIGDPIEFEALSRAFASAPRGRSCALGAVKANIGHLDNAAGIAGLIKAALAVHHAIVPPATHFEQPNPAIAFDDSPFYVNTEAEPWGDDGTPRRAAVSSFGVGGTNAHVVLEQAPPRARSGAPRPVQIVSLSARTPDGVRETAAALARWIETHPRLEARDVAFTRNARRRSFACRAHVVAGDHDEMITALRAPLTIDTARPAVRVGFMFTGQGAPHVGMARALYEGEPCFRDALTECLDSLEPPVAARLLDLLCARGGGSDTAAELLVRPEHALPALLALEYSLVQLWKAWGIQPAAVIGHSFGEIVAASVAGVFPVADAMRLALARGRLMQRMAPGRMLAVALPEGEAARLVDRAVAIAAVNADERVVLSGATEPMARVEAALLERGASTQWLNVPFAYHSPLLDPLLDEYRALMAQTSRGALITPCVSTLTADWLTDDQARDPQYWALQARQPVRFAAGLRRMRDGGVTALVEIGPGQGLANLARQVFDGGVLVAPSLGRDGGGDVADWRALLDAAGRLWAAGAPIAWEAIEEAQQGWCVPLPGYPFARRRLWIEPTQPAEASTSVPAAPRGIAAVPADLPPADTASSTAAPSPGSVEATLAAIWSDVLGRPVGLHENFFELGGDSLTAMRILSRLQQALPVSVSFEQMLTAPTVADLARALEHTVPAPVASVGTTETRALSYAQETLWTQQRLAPASAAYHLPLAVRLRGPFDGATFHAALGDVVARQEVLRTVFTLGETGPIADVRPGADVVAPVVDLTECAEERREALARRAAALQIRLSFDMAQAPPWRVAIVRLAPDDHVVVFVLHHIIADGWSMNILVNEVTTCYVARRFGAPVPLPPLPLQYRQFADQQRREVEADDGVLAAYWRQHLADVPPLLTLSGRPRPPVKSYRGGRHGFRIEPALAERLAGVARREQATLFMVALTAFEALLFRLTGQQEFCVGAPTAGRLRPETEPIIGCFINTLPVRADISGDPTFGELLRRVRRATLDAFAHQALPFGRIVHEVRPARSPSYSPLYQVVFDFNSTPPPEPPQYPEIAVEPFGAPPATAKTDLIVDLWRGGDGGLLGGIEYDVALFDAADAERIGARFVRALEAIAEDQEANVSAFALDSEEERARRARIDGERDAARRERLAAIKGGRRTHATHGH